MQVHANLNNSGFTLIEFLVALVIMMVGLLGLLQTVNYAYSHNLATALRNEAISVCDEEMVVEKSKAFDNISTKGVASPNVKIVPRNLRNASKDYTVSKTGEMLGDSKQVTITVTWQYKTTQYSHVISTLLTK